MRVVARFGVRMVRGGGKFWGRAVPRSVSSPGLVRAFTRRSLAAGRNRPEGELSQTPYSSWKPVPIGRESSTSIFGGVMMLADFRSVFLPYCIKRLDDQRHVVLNRGYKPLGFATSEHVDYENFPICVQLRGLGAAKARELSWNKSDDLDNIYLYNDGCVPTSSREAMDSYLSKLCILAALGVVPKEAVRT